MHCVQIVAPINVLRDAEELTAAESASLARVFLSYARENADAARELAVALNASGHEVWWDHQIHGGCQFSKEIDRALGESDAVVVLWSTASAQSTWVLDEAAEGRDAGKLVPALIEPCKPPLGYRQYQAINLTKWRDDASVRKELLDAIMSLSLSSDAGESGKNGKATSRPVAAPSMNPDTRSRRGSVNRLRAKKRTTKAVSAHRPVITVQGMPPTDDRRLAVLQEWAEAELVDRLTRLRWLSVVRADAKPGRADGEVPVDHTPGYVVDLDLAESDRGTCLTARLMTRHTSHMLLLRRFELAEASDDALLEPMRELVAAIDNHLELTEQQRVLRKPLDRLTADEIIWRARWHLNRLTREDAMLAGQLLDGVLSEAPDWSEALIQAGFVRAWTVWASRGSEAQVLELRNLGARAIAADQFDARGYLLVGMADTWLRHSTRARHALEEAIRLNPSLCQAYMQLGSALYLAGDAKAALEPMEIALRLNPLHTQAFCLFAELGMAHLMLGDCKSAVDSAELALLRKPGYWFAHVVKISALAQMGDADSARRAHADLMHVKPRFSLRYLDWIPFVDEHWPHALRQGLESVGQVSFAST